MPETRRPFPAAIWPTLSAAVLLLGGPAPVRADDILEQQKRIDAVKAQELNAQAREVLVQAYNTAKKDPAKAADLLRLFRPRIEESKFLTEERRRDLFEAFDVRIRDYEARGRQVGRPGSDETRAAAQDRQQQLNSEEQKKADLARMQLQRSELLKQGRFEDVARMGDDIRSKYGNIPAAEAFSRISAAQSRYNEMRALRGERDRRAASLMRDIVRSSMPVVGDVEFPANWKELTRRRKKLDLTETEQKLIRALNTPITTSIKDKPLRGVLEYLEKTTGLPIQLDPAAVVDGNPFNYETHVGIEARGQTTRTVLKKLLADVGLTYVIRNETLRVTTPERASQDLVLRTYYIGDLLQSANGFQFGPVSNQLQLVQNVASMIAFIQSVEPTSWREGGGPGSIAFNPGSMSLVVKQTAEMQWVLMGALRP